MKRFLFTILTLVALVMVANTVFADNETSVYPGGTYTYVLDGVTSVNAATATVDYDGSNETITEVGGSYTITAGTTNGTVSFTIKYGSATVPASDGDITVQIQDGVSTCSNYISLTIDVLDTPALTVGIAADGDNDGTTGEGTADDEICQAVGNTTNGQPGSQGETNTIAFVVTGSVTNATAYSYEYDITFADDDAGFSITGVSYSGPGSYTGDATGGTVSGINNTNDAAGTFTVTFNTTTGLDAVDITATLTDASELTETSSSVVYAGTESASSDIVTVKSTPSIGGFN